MKRFVILSALFLLMISPVFAKRLKIRKSSPVADYNVTGDIDPNAKGNYFVAGIYNEKSYYRRDDGEYSIWWKPDEMGWYISPAPGSYPPYWVHTASEILGTYESGQGASGIATVSAGPH